jgi:hypothetical protein
MNKRLPNPASALSLVALFVALGGTGYAAFGLPRNSVGSKQLKNGAVTSGKIKNGAVTGSKIASGAVSGSKLDLSGVTVPNASHATSADSAASAANATTASNANALGGSPASAFAQASDIQTAFVTNNGTSATLVRGTAIAATRLGAPEVDVEFPRDVSNCTWNATAGNPGNGAVAPLIATVRGDTNGPDHVLVVLFNTSGLGADGDFDLTVVC